MSLDALLVAQDYTASTAEQKLRMLMGALLDADWKEALVARGFGWHVAVGTFSTPIAGGGNGTILDSDQPELSIAIPSGTTFIPLRVRVDCQVPLLAADSEEAEILISVDRTQLADTTAASGTVETPLNMRTDRIGGCPCPVLSAVTVNLSPDPVRSMELAHAVALGDFQGTPANAMWTQLMCNYEPLRPPFVVGPAGFNIYWGGTVAVSGFAAAEFLAIPSSLLTALS